MLGNGKKWKNNLYRAKMYNFRNSRKEIKAIILGITIIKKITAAFFKASTILMILILKKEAKMKAAQKMNIKMLIIIFRFWMIVLMIRRMKVRGIYLNKTIEKLI